MTTCADAFVHESADVDESAHLGPRTQVWHLAQVRSGATLGESCIVGRGAYVGPGAVIGAFCKIQNYAQVHEPATLGNGVFIGPGAVLTNDHSPRSVSPDGSLKRAGAWEASGVRIGEGASVGALAVCVAPIHIGCWAMVGAGAVVTKDVPDFAMVVGNPARFLRWVGRSGETLVQQTEGFWLCSSSGELYGLDEQGMRLIGSA